MKEYQHVLIEKKYHEVLEKTADENFMKMKVYIERLLLRDPKFQNNLKASFIE